MMAWQVRDLEAAALAAIETRNEAGRSEFWSRVQEHAHKRFKTSLSDAREGALALLARVVAASSCLDPSRVPGALMADEQIKSAVTAELIAIVEHHHFSVVPEPYDRSNTLACGWIRTQIMGLPMEASRVGSAAVLTFLELLAKDERLKLLYAEIRARRDVYQGRVTTEPLLAWRDQAGKDPEASLEAMAEFLEKLAVASRAPPPLLAVGHTPFEQFFLDLKDAERLAAFEDLAQVIQDGRLSESLTDARTWLETRESALTALAVQDPSAPVQFSSGAKDRLIGAFAALQNGHHEVSQKSRDLPAAGEDRSDLYVRLRVPPSLELEPVPQVFSRLADGLEKLTALLKSEGLTKLAGLDRGGERQSKPVASEANTLIQRLRGLAALASWGALAQGPHVAAARHFLSTWRSDESLARDVRHVSALPWLVGKERPHTAVLGVVRTEVAVGFGTAPRATLVGPAADFELAPAEQRYLVPMLLTVGQGLPPDALPMNASRLRNVLESVSRDREAAVGQVLEALHRDAR
jgi:hypothetical protein